VPGHTARSSSSKDSRRPPIVALVWAQYGPYHFARLKGLSKNISTLRVLGVEIGSKSMIYAWVRGEVPTDLHTLCPGVSAEGASALSIYFRALKFFSDQQVEVVLIPSYWPASSLALFLAARSAGAKVLMMTDSHAHTAKAKWIFAWIKRWLVRQFDGALVGGAPHKAYFTHLGMKPETIVTGYDVVDNDYFIKASAAARADADQVRAKHGLPDRYFLNVGRIVWKKNLQVLVDAYKKVRENLGPECPRLVLVGSGDRENALQEHCRAAGLSVARLSDSAHGNCKSDADVFFLGFQADGGFARNLRVSLGLRSAQSRRGMGLGGQ